MRRRLLLAATVAGAALVALEARWLGYLAARERTDAAFSGASFVEAEGRAFRTGDHHRFRFPLVLHGPGEKEGPQALELDFPAQPGYAMRAAFHQVEGSPGEGALLRLSLDGQPATTVRMAPGRGRAPSSVPVGDWTVHEVALAGTSPCGSAELRVEMLEGTWVALDRIDVALVPPKGIRTARRVALAATLILFGVLAATTVRAPTSWSAGRFAADGVLLLCGTLAAFAVGELALRLVVPRLGRTQILFLDSSRATESGSVEEALRSHVCAEAPCSRATCGFRLDEGGRHTAPFSKEKAPGTFRVVGIGDSFMNYGGPVPHEEEWFVRIGSSLSRELQPIPVEPINLGFSCIGIPTELRILEEMALPLAPDLIVWSIYVGNDLTDETGPSPARPPSPWDRFLLARLLGRLPTIATLGPRQLVRPCAPELPRAGCGQLEDPAVPYDPATPTMSDAWYRNYVEGRLRQAYVPASRRTMERNVKMAVARLAQARTMATGTRLLLVILPDELLVSPAELERALELVPEVDRVGLDLEAPGRELVAGLATAGIETCDLTQELRVAAARGEAIYQPNDGHLALQGNRLVAARVLAELRERRMVPR